MVTRAQVDYTACVRIRDETVRFPVRVISRYRIFDCGCDEFKGKKKFATGINNDSERASPSVEKKLIVYVLIVNSKSKFYVIDSHV